MAQMKTVYHSAFELPHLVPNITVSMAAESHIEKVTSHLCSVSKIRAAFSSSGKAISVSRDVGSRATIAPRLNKSRCSVSSCVLTNSSTSLIIWSVDMS